MHARVVVNRIPYVIAPSPDKRTNLFRSVTSCKKLNERKHSVLLLYNCLSKNAYGELETKKPKTKRKSSNYLFLRT